ncbi:phosphoglucosamine mutase [Halovenus marina]|uniref:phosphoglucosamine mutase n=1 Tax=Halovenus marina TaxID=3396621 RepID=UPI003F57423E
MFGTSGIRGSVGEEVTGQVALSVGRALGIETDRVVVGRDARESGHALTDAFAAGLCESGVDVVDVGRAATPTVARGVAWTDADAGVVITASHNPPTDNGIKLWQPSGQAFDAPRRERITERVRSGETALADWDEMGTRTRDSLSDRHRRELVESVTLSEPLEVVVDVGNGVGGVTADALDELGCHVQTLNAQQDGSFPGRPSEPTAENCESLSTLVAETDADLGIAHDGDADRMRAVAADGTFLSGDVLLAIFARATAGEGDAVAMPVDTSLAVADALAERGIEATYTPVGDVYVAAAASDPGVAFGGEPSGAWIWPEETLCPDGPLAACKLAELTASEPLADRAATVAAYPIVRDSVSVSEKTAVMDRVRELVSERYDDFSTLDGVRVERDDAWFLLRASGTEPLVRVTAEARERSRAQQVFEEATNLLDEGI